jgi:hypothetical protein
MHLLLLVARPRAAELARELARVSLQEGWSGALIRWGAAMRRQRRRGGCSSDAGRQATSDRLAQQLRSTKEHAQDRKRRGGPADTRRRATHTFPALGRRTALNSTAAGHDVRTLCLDCCCHPRLPPLRRGQAAHRCFCRSYCCLKHSPHKPHSNHNVRG